MQIFLTQMRASFGEYKNKIPFCLTLSYFFGGFKKGGKNDLTKKQIALTEGGSFLCQE